MAFSSSPNRANCVNDKPRRQPISASNFTFTGSTTTEGPAFRKQFSPGGAMNCAINSSATEERRVRRVYNRINIEFRDVVADDVDFAVGILHEWCSQ
jgi:hypothetical protein